MDKEETTSSKPDSPSWKLYNNPHYTNLKPPQKHAPYTCISNTKSSYKTSDHDLNLSDLDNALTEIKRLRAELEFERRIRNKIESANKALMKSVMEEKKAREEAESHCQNLGMEIKQVREEFEGAMKEAEDERRMLRTAEGMREERLQMKLSDARILMEERIKEMSPLKMSRVENPHIKRGIKGMEFPKPGRGRSGDSTKGSPGSLGSNLECQRAQLRVLMRLKNEGGVCNENLVM